MRYILLLDIYMYANSYKPIARHTLFEFKSPKPHQIKNYFLSDKQRVPFCAFHAFKPQSFTPAKRASLSRPNNRREGPFYFF